jgi:ribosome maturation factor RimP
MLELIQEVSLPLLEGMGYELVDLDDCERVSRSVSAILDRKDWISVPYFLEVSSPGIERVLKKDKDWIRFKGAPVNVSLFAAIEGKKVYQGALGEVSDQELCLTAGDREIRLPRDQITLVRLAWEV